MKKHPGNFISCLPLLLAACLVLLLSACGKTAQLSPETEEGVLVYAALNPVSKELTRSVEQFNKNHPDAQIEIRDYSDEGGLDRLRTELVLGQVPDIMEMHYYGKAGAKVFGNLSGSNPPLLGSYTGQADEYWMPYRQMVQKGYLEDLWPYIESDPKLGREKVLQAPLKAAEVDGGLYMLFQQVQIYTLVGRESVVGDRYGWTLEELMEAFAAMPEGSTILRYNMTKRDVFFNLLCFSLNQYVDRETGECLFDSQGFRDLTALLESLPDGAAYEDPAVAEDEIKRNIWYGRQMLEGMLISWPQHLAFADTIWQGRAVFPGYPAADGDSGGFYYIPGDILAMSSVCRNKDAAWEYIRTLITPRLRNRVCPPSGTYIRVNLHDYEACIWFDLDQSEDIYLAGLQGFGMNYFKYGSDIPIMHPLTEEDAQRYRDLVDHTTQIYWPDDSLTDIVWDTLGAYFAGDRDLDPTVALIQNRVRLYVNENR